MAAEIILINPPPLNWREKHDALNHPHLGLAYLSAYLRQNNFECQPIDAKFERMNLEELGKAIKKYRPILVGITAMTHEIGQAAQVARLVKELFPEVKTVLGGAHATALPQETLRQFPEFDMAIVGEGEITLLELVKTLIQRGELSKIAGLAFRPSSDAIILNNCRQPIQNLDSLPFPAWNLFPPSQTYSLITTRGCPFRCKFCMRVSGNQPRKRSYQNVLEEFKMDINKYGAGQILVEDESFGLDRKQAYPFLDALADSGLNKKVKWVTQTRVDLVDEEFFQKLKAAGCAWVGFGVESGNEKILKEIGKGITLKKVEESISLAKKTGLQTGSYFIIGHPYETKQTAWDTINFAAKLNTTTVAFGIMVPYPGTEIYSMALRGEGGYRIISSDWADFNKTIGASLELETLSRKELEKLQLLAYFVFYFKNWRFWDFFKLLL
ncbi:MAG: radical SAM protein, partial [Patescibacteria group bacterium]